MNPDFIVLAAGNGKRMLESSPKVLSPIGGKPMAQHILDTVSSIEKSRSILVVGDQAKEVKNSLQFKRNTKIVTQRKHLGTANAVKTALDQLRPSSVTVVLYGDVPLIESITLKRHIRDSSKGSLAILTFNKDLPLGY